jgi:RNA polymerase sigma-70 factor (ECF subfamily)
MIDRAGHEDSAGPRPAMSDLLRRYVPALRAHLLARRAVAPQQVDDVVQSFISGKLLEAELLERADRTKGKFRTLLLTALDRFVISEHRRDQAEKRGAARTDSLETNLDARSAASGDDRADAFDVAWARQILAETLRRMKEQCEADRRLDLWGVFQARVLRPTLEGGASADYDAVVTQYAYRSPTQLWNAVRTAKHLYARILRSVIAEYAPAPEDVDEELLDLRRICARLPQAEGLPAYP